MGNSAKKKLLIGAHVGGGLKGAIPKALEINANVMQIFIGSPQTWAMPASVPSDIDTFKQKRSLLETAPLFVHGNYLVNLASQTKDNLSKSISNLSMALRAADAAGAEGLIFHPGSAGASTYKDALDRVVRSINAVLEDYKGRCRLLLEVCAGQGQTIGDEFSEFADILKALDFDKRIGVCWDTCHLYNAGYDVASAEGLKKTVDEFESEVGFERLFAIHANDSKTPLGAKRDRHENIGEGHIGAKAFARMLHHPQLRYLPWILEVPGFEKKGPDRKNIEIMHQLAN